MALPKDLFSAAMFGGNVRRYGDMVVLAMPGMGLVTTQQDMQQAQAWARAKVSSGMVHKDRESLVGRIETVIARVNSGCATRGSGKVIAGLVTIMKSSGMDLESWTIPRAVLEELFPPRKPPPQPRGLAAARDAAADDTAPDAAPRTP